MIYLVSLVEYRVTFSQHSHVPFSVTHSHTIIIVLSPTHSFLILFFQKKRLRATTTTTKTIQRIKESNTPTNRHIINFTRLHFLCIEYENKVALCVQQSWDSYLFNNTKFWYAHATQCKIKFITNFIPQKNEKESKNQAKTQDICLMIEMDFTIGETEIIV